MADLSLGPLRIANPDDISPDFQTQQQRSRSTSDLSPLTATSGPMDFNPETLLPKQSPASPPTPSSANPVQPAASTRPLKDTYVSRDRNLGHTYQDQQTAQFPQYPTMMPQNLHDPHSNAARPVSNYYTQTPSNGSKTGVYKQNSYRKRGDSANDNGIPQRSTSRGSALASQPGVPTRDGSHVDKGYGPQYLTGNGPVPPRRASRGLGAGRMSASSPGTNITSLSGTPVAQNGVLSSSPYNVEGGPVSSSEEWKERGAAVGMQQDYDANGKPVTRYVKKGVKDFNFGQTLGEGSYSTVLAAQDRQSLKDYAIKVLDKRHIIKEKKVKYVNIEKDTLNRLTDHPGVVRLYYTFQDERSLYFVLDLCSGGELLGTLKRMTTFDETCTRFYCAQILDTIEYMHQRGVIHRDLKPENVLLDDQMHVKITDFGTAKILALIKDANGNTEFQADATPEENRASSFVGTAEYVSPELLTDKNACKASDLWAFGCIVYQLLAGRPPFKAGNEYQTFQKIVALDYAFPRGFPPAALDLVERLLVLDPQRRLSIEHIKNHEFFAGIQWGRGLWQQKAPRLKTYVPPPNPPINLNGVSSNDNYAQNMSSHSTHATMLPPANSAQRGQPRLITELPPPSQLDIEWSPVLTRNNERILKLGNLTVFSSQNGHNPHNGDGGGKLSRLFGGNNNKKRQRLVMVTSSARIVVAAAGGEEKKAKMEIHLLHPGTELASSTDSKGVTHWTVKTMDRCFDFEDPKPSSSDPMASATSAQEWLDVVKQAKEFAMSQPADTLYSADESYNMSSSALSSHANTLDQASGHSQNSVPSSSRAILHKQHSGGDAESLKGGRKRFSKRQSKSGLTAVF